jgi:tetratricopeptide (TPR) repeat protein
LQRFLELRPVEARRPTLVERAAKWSRRHWAAVTTAVAVLLVAAMAAAGLKLQTDRRTRDVADAVRTSIAVTRTAIEADDLKLAGQKLSEAEGNLRLAAASLPHLAETLGQLRGELEQREQDAERFEQLMELARDAQDKMTHAADRGGEEVAEEALELFVLPGDDWRARLDFAAVDAQQAVALAGVLADDHWLEGGSLTAEQQRQVRETIYETLLCLADFGVRWDERRSEESARTSLEYLEVAALFREPTRGFYWVRAECHAYLGDDEAAEADRERYEQTPARFALDHYLPSHTAGWRGDLDEAIRAYRAALTLQPDNYNAMFFLGMRLESQQRFEKAALAFRACIALRPLESDACWRCADALRQLQRFDEAEQALVTGLDRARRELGEEHPWTLSAMVRLQGQTYYE